MRTATHMALTMDEPIDMGEALRQSVVYVSGPYRAKTPAGVKHNVATADRAAKHLRVLGYAVICPHKNSEGDSDHESCLAADMSIIDRLDKDDSLYMLKGWRESEGSIAEWWRALNRGLRWYQQGCDEPPNRGLTSAPSRV